MKRLGVVWCGVVSLGGANAASVSAGEVCQLVLASRTQVVAYMPALEAQGWAECLRAARVDYRRNVILLSVPYFARSKSSFVNSLALADVKVFEANVDSTRGFLLIDSQAFSAERLGLSDQQRLQRLPARETAALANWFNTALQSAKFLTPTQAFLRLGR